MKKTTTTTPHAELQTLANYVRVVTARDAKRVARIKELEQALSDMWTQADEDCPAEYRTAHFRTAMKQAIKVLNKGVTK